MRLTVCSFLFMILMIGACSRSKSNISFSKEIVSPSINDLLSKLKGIPSGYEYDLVSQDDENCFKTTELDSLYFSEYISVIGYLPDTSNYYAILYLEPGDDLYPSLKVFSKSGKLIDSKSIAYADCAAGDCSMDSCASFVRLIDKTTIERSLLLKSTKCDSLGNKIIGETSNIEKKQLITISTSGEIKFGIEKMN